METNSISQEIKLSNDHILFHRRAYPTNLYMRDIKKSIKAGLFLELHTILLRDSEGNDLKTKVHRDNAEKFSASFHYLLHGECRRNCQSLGANLASVHSKLENDFLLSLVASSTLSWVGAHDGEQEGQWLWSDGTAYDYTNWCTSEPNNVSGAENCLEINWTYSGATHGFVIESVLYVPHSSKKANPDVCFCCGCAAFLRAVLYSEHTARPDS
ncbi:Ladderlectin [Anabarilius grahami]|uniref:Ladderlectin n=1 Tax=Anabarilius grahami TaxID=495550 RepID=A0A3N0XLQ4_ANAGA|nr:Ladderlectin [Anabarilius grahami]